jgi:hypothetical protein
VSIALIVIRPSATITLSEWMRLVDEDENLRLRAEPYVALNLRTKRSQLKRAKPTRKFS